MLTYFPPRMLFFPPEIRHVEIPLWLQTRLCLSEETLLSSSLAKTPSQVYDSSLTVIFRTLAILSQGLLASRAAEKEPVCVSCPAGDLSFLLGCFSDGVASMLWVSPGMCSGVAVSEFVLLGLVVVLGCDIDASDPGLRIIPSSYLSGHLPPHHFHLFLSNS